MIRADSIAEGIPGVLCGQAGRALAVRHGRKRIPVQDVAAARRCTQSFLREDLPELAWFHDSGAGESRRM